MIPFIGPLISGLFGLGKTYFKDKAEVKAAKHERTLTVIKQDGDWDVVQAQNANNSWKDEFITIVLLAPFISMFTAAVFGWEDAVQRHKEAFIVLSEDVPDEYWYLLAVVVAASFGVKKVIEGVQSLRNK